MSGGRRLDADLAGPARHLLATGLLARTDRPEEYRVGVRNLAELEFWFAGRFGWKIVHLRRAEALRLFKRSDTAPADRGPVVPEAARAVASARVAAASRIPGKPAGAEVLAILWVVCAQLWRRPKVTLRTLQADVSRACAADPSRLPAFAVVADSDGVTLGQAQRSRRTLVDAIVLLAHLGVLDVATEIDSARTDDTVDVVITASEEMLGNLLACPPPSLLDLDEAPADAHVGLLGAAELGGVDRRDEPGRRREAAMRAVVDDPTATAEAHPYLGTSAGRPEALTVLADVGLVVTARSDAWQITDPTGEVTDRRFPRGRSMIRQAALLLLARVQDGGALARTDALDVLAAVRADLPTWAASHPRLQGLLDHAAAELAEMGLVVDDGETLNPTPAARLWDVRVTLPTPPAPATQGMLL